jgi:hypothetical protein
MGAGHTNDQIAPKNLARAKTGVCDMLDISLTHTWRLTVGSWVAVQTSYGYVYVQFQGNRASLRHGTTGPLLFIAKLPRVPHRVVDSNIMHCCAG